MKSVGRISCRPIRSYLPVVYTGLCVCDGVRLQAAAAAGRMRRAVRSSRLSH